MCKSRVCEGHAQYHETLHSNLTRGRDVLLKEIKSWKSPGQFKCTGKRKESQLTRLFLQALAMEGINEKKKHVCFSLLYILLYLYNQQIWLMQWSPCSVFECCLHYHPNGLNMF